MERSVAVARTLRHVPASSVGVRFMICLWEDELAEEQSILLLTILDLIAATNLSSNGSVPQTARYYNGVIRNYTLSLGRYTPEFSLQPVPLFWDIEWNSGNQGPGVNLGSNAHLWFL
eukprot:1181252-Prorocentrum_minimum.AAC.2